MAVVLVHYTCQKVGLKLPHVTIVEVAIWGANMNDVPSRFLQNMLTKISQFHILLIPNGNLEIRHHRSLNTVGTSTYSLSLICPLLSTPCTLSPNSSGSRKFEEQFRRLAPSSWKRDSGTHLHIHPQDFSLCRQNTVQNALEKC